MTSLRKVKEGIVTEEIKFVSLEENVSEHELMELFASGKVVIPKNSYGRKFHVYGIGKGLLTKINVNIGTSPKTIDLEEETKKVEISNKHNVESIMDLSTGGDTYKIREMVLKKADMMVGTVPIYDTVKRACDDGTPISKIKSEDFFKDIEVHGKQGVDFITVHCGVTKKSLESLASSKRLVGIVSRGGAIMAEWIKKTGNENPLFERYDRLLEIAAKYDMTLSLGDGLRPGSIHDASDPGQISELVVLGGLAKKANEYGVQVMIEGPGHIPINQIKSNMEIQKRLCNEAPFYVLGPLVTDIAMGYDHISAAIGASIAGSYGADFLCYVTPKEHVGLPTLSEVEDGIIALKIAAHASDLAKGKKSAWEKDRLMSQARGKLDWEGQIKNAINPDKVREMLKDTMPKPGEPCTMCGEFCPMKRTGEE